MKQPYLGDFRITKLYGTPPPAGCTYSTGKHSGIDLVGVTDKIVRAVLGGTVFRAGYDEKGWGKYIVIQQSDGNFAIYCHLSKCYKATGQCVRAGDMLGIEGATGQVTGAHLHLEFRRKYGDKYSTFNPAVYLGLADEVGPAKVVNEELERELTIMLNGKARQVQAIEKNGNNYVKLQDLRDDRIIIGYAGGKPTVSVK